MSAEHTHGPTETCPDDGFRGIVHSQRLKLDTVAIETEERADRYMYIRELAWLLLTNPDALDQVTVTFFMRRGHRDADSGVAGQARGDHKQLLDILDNAVDDWTDRWGRRPGLQRAHHGALPFPSSVAGHRPPKR
jgi:hypothetical protein